MKTMYTGFAAEVKLQLVNFVTSAGHGRCFVPCLSQNYIPNSGPCDHLPAFTTAPFTSRTTGAQRSIVSAVSLYLSMTFDRLSLIVLTFSHSSSIVSLRYHSIVKLWDFHRKFILGSQNFHFCLGLPLSALGISFVCLVTQTNLHLQTYATHWTPCGHFDHGYTSLLGPTCSKTATSDKKTQYTTYALSQKVTQHFIVSLHLKEKPTLSLHNHPTTCQ